MLLKNETVQIENNFSTNTGYRDLKVLFLLEACFDLISGSSISMKIQIMGKKITDNQGPAD